MLGSTQWTLACLVATMSALAARDAGAQPRPTPKDETWLRSRIHETRTHLGELQDELKRIQAGLKLVEAQFQAPPKADIHAIDGMSTAFVLTNLHVWVDDVPAFVRDDEHGALGAARELHWVTGALSAGEHVVRVAIQLHGNGAIVPYMRAYRFELVSSHKFTASSGRTTTVSIRATERSDEATPFVHLPAVEWDD